MSIQASYICTHTSPGVHACHERSKFQERAGNNSENHKTSYHFQATRCEFCDCVELIKIGLISAALTPVIVPVVGTTLIIGATIGAACIGTAVVILGSIGIAAAAVVYTVALPVFLAAAMLSCII